MDEGRNCREEQPEVGGKTTRGRRPEVGTTAMEEGRWTRDETAEKNNQRSEVRKDRGTMEEERRTDIGMGFLTTGEPATDQRVNGLTGQQANGITDKE